MDEFVGSDELAGPDGEVDWVTVPDHLIPTCVVGSERSRDRQASRARSRFVKGPLPLGWIGAAVRCGDPRALSVLLALKAKADTERQNWIKPPAVTRQDLVVDRMARSRAIAALERAGLIEVRRRRGRPPLVWLVPWKD